MPNSWPFWTVASHFFVIDDVIVIHFYHASYCTIRSNLLCTCWTCDRKCIIIRIDEFWFLMQSNNLAQETCCSPEFYESSSWYDLCMQNHGKSAVHQTYVKFLKFEVFNFAWVVVINLCSCKLRNSRKASIRKQINFLKFVQRNYHQQILFIQICSSQSCSFRSKISKFFNIIYQITRERYSWVKKSSSFAVYISTRKLLFRDDPCYLFA